jgi:geranylgeranyl reductase family protein
MKYDVIVVGAGPAGSTAAKFLSEKGVKVLLIDKHKFPRDKPCGGGIPIRVINRFKYIEEKGLIDSYSCGGFAYFSSSKHKVTLQRDNPIYATILRNVFDYDLVKLAIKSGATFVDGKKVKDIKLYKNKAAIILEDGAEIESKIIIGADGIWSITAKKTGLGQHGKMVGMCLYKEYQMDSKFLDEYFTKKRLGYMHHRVLGINGFGWVIPKKEHLNIGIGEIRNLTKKSQTKTKLVEVYTDYLNNLKKNKFIPQDFPIDRPKGAVVPACPLNRTYSDRVILCGDAAGLANPSTGAGIEYAMISGKIAAEVISDALETGNINARFLSKYESLWKKDFGKDIKIFLKIQKRWGKQTERFIKLIGKDKQLAEMAFDIIIGNSRIYSCTLRFIKRLFFFYIRDIYQRIR